VLNLPLAPVFAQMLRIPYGYLYPIILLTSFVGAYAVSNNMFSVLLVLIFGIVGWVMKELDLPMAPLVLGLVLGPLFEKSLVQTSALGEGNFGILFTSPIAVTILAFAAVLTFAPMITRRIVTARRTAEAAREKADAAR